MMLQETAVTYRRTSEPVTAAMYIPSKSDEAGIPIMTVAVAVAALIILVLIIVAAVLFTKHR